MGVSIYGIQQQYNTTVAVKIDVSTQWYDDTQVQLLTCQKQVIIAYFTYKTTLFCGYFEGFTSQIWVTFHNYTSCSDNVRKAGGNYITLHKNLNKLQDLRIVLPQQEMMSLPT